MLVSFYIFINSLRRLGWNTSWEPCWVCYCGGHQNTPFRCLQELADLCPQALGSKVITVVRLEAPFPIGCSQPMTEHGRDIKVSPFCEDIWLLMVILAWKIPEDLAKFFWELHCILTWFHSTSPLYLFPWLRVRPTTQPTAPAARVSQLFHCHRCFPS